MLAIVGLSLLGQGEPVRLDPRFGTPQAALQTYWQAVEANDPDAILECALDADGPGPFPGMLWTLPPMQEVTLTHVHCVPLDGERVVALYRVDYRLAGVPGEQQMPMSTELVRVSGEWRVTRALAEAGSLEEWRPVPRPVDI